MRSHTFGRFAAVLLAGGALFWSPGHLAAQACLGSPMHTGQTAIDLGVSLHSRATGYGVGITKMLGGPVSLSANAATYDLEIIDANQHRFEARMAYQLPVERLSICPALGAGYSTFGYELNGVGVNFSELYFPVGLGIGKELELARGLSLIPSAMVNLFLIREKRSATNWDDTVSVTETTYGLGARES
jgi:hypothetical protein